MILKNGSVNLSLKSQVFEILKFKNQIPALLPKHLTDFSLFLHFWNSDGKTFQVKVVANIIIYKNY